MKLSFPARSRRLAAAPALLATLLVGCATSGGLEAPIPGLFDVPYSEVTALQVRSADERLEYGSSPLQFALGWRPLDGKPRALVVFVHGGCWLSDYDLEHGRAVTAALADAGYETWAIEYRRSGDEGGGWPGSLEDVVTAVQALHDQRESRPLLLVGHSAGGHLALLAAQRMPSSVTAIVGLAAITDVIDYARGTNGCQQATPRFFGGLPDEAAEEYREATVTADGLEERATLLHGHADAIVPVSQANVGDLETKRLERVGHFDWVHPRSHAFSVLLEVLEERIAP
ncbi:MAG: alpha/beta fold hydrolase [Acidobacteriota bacterium]